MISRRRLILLAWLALLAGCALLSTRARVTNDFTAFLPAKLDAGQELLVHQLRDGVAARLILIGISGGQPQALAEASRQLARRLSASQYFAYVNNGEAQFSAADRDLVTRYRYVLSPTGANLAPARLRDSLARALEALGSPLGSMAAATLPSDPTGEARRFLESLPGGMPEVRLGVWFSPDGTRALLIAETRASASDLDTQQQAIGVIRSAFEAIDPMNARATYSLTLSGPGVFGVKSRAMIQADASRLSLIAGAAVIGILLLVYRSLALTLACFVPIMSGMLAGVAVVSAVFGSIHGITLGFAAILFGEAVDYPSYLFIHNQPGDTLRDTLLRIRPTLRLAVLTTVLGGLTMLLSSFTGLAQLGLLLMTGVLVAGLVTGFVLPEIMPERPVPITGISALLAWTVMTRWRRPIRWAAWGAAVLAVAAIIVRPGTLWDDDIGNLNPIPEADRRIDQQLRAELKAPDVRAVIVIRAPDREQALERSEALSDALRRFIDAKLIAGFEMASEFLPSVARQRARQAVMPDPPALRRSLDEAARGLPFRAGLFEPFLRDVEQARTGAPLDLDAFRATGLALKVGSLLFPLRGEWIALVPLRGVVDPAALAARFAALGATGAELLDLRAEAGRMISRYRNESLRLTALGIAAMLALLLWGLSGAREALRVILPVLLAVAIEIGVLPLLGSSLTIFHLVSLLFVIGTGLNYSLFFNRVPHDPDERRRTVLSVTVCSLATLCSAGSLAFSATPVLHAIGLTVLVGTPLALVLSAGFGRDAAALSARR